MKMASVTSLLKYYPLPAALQTIADAGYEGVELWGGFPHAWSEDFYDGDTLDKAAIERCRQLIRDSGLELVSYLPEQCFYPVNFLVDDAPPFDASRLAERSLRYFERAIDVAAALGSPHMALTTPFWGWERQDGAKDGAFVHTRIKRLDRVISAFRRLATQAERVGVVLIVEPLTHLETTAVETLDDSIQMLEGVGSDHLAMMLDTGHANVTARQLGEDPAAYFRHNVERLGDRLRHVHLSDNFGDLDAHLLPGEGNFDFADAYAALKDSGYGGYLSAELLMFGANPVPPAPAELLARTRAHTLGLWNG